VPPLDPEDEDEEELPPGVHAEGASHRRVRVLHHQPPKHSLGAHTPLLAVQVHSLMSTVAPARTPQVFSTPPPDELADPWPEEPEDAAGHDVGGRSQRPVAVLHQKPL
jgi:hypothetical protein